MDFIQSALEASPYGFSGYGFEPYIQGSGANFVNGLCSYWVDHTQAMLDFEASNPEVTCSVRYEDLVAEPGVVAEGIWKFLDLDESPELISRIFELPHDQFGPADYKIWGRTAISNDSVGSGLVVPGMAVAPLLRSRVNELLDQLEYAAIDDFWGRVERPPIMDPHTAASVCANSRSTEVQVNESSERVIRLIVTDRLRPVWARTVDLDTLRCFEEEASDSTGLYPAVVTDELTAATLQRQPESYEQAQRIRRVRFYPSPRWQDGQSAVDHGRDLSLQVQAIAAAKRILLTYWRPGPQII